MPRAKPAHERSNKMLTIAMNEAEYTAVKRVAARHGMDMSQDTRTMVSCDAWTDAMLDWLRELRDRLPEIALGEQLSEDTDWAEFKLRAALVNEVLDHVKRLEGVGQRIRQLFVPTLQGLMEILESLPATEEGRDDDD
jgi:hypothetical protein